MSEDQAMPGPPRVEYSHRVTFVAKPDNIIVTITAYGPEDLGLSAGDVIQTMMYSRARGRNVPVTGVVVGTERGPKIA